MQAGTRARLHFNIEFSPKIRVALPAGQKLKVVGHSEN
jgi:hypothetical protein